MIDQDFAAGSFFNARSDLQRVSKAADKMTRLLEEVLKLSRVGRTESPREHIAFELLVQDALELVAGRLKERHVRVEVEPHLPAVMVDRARMAEVLLNLVDNAAKFMGDQADPCIQVGACTKDGETRFFVKDNGIGVEEKHHTKIFGLFDKLNPQSEGSGAGLAIVQRIIGSHGGRIWIESPAEGGATFWFTLNTQATKGDHEVQRSTANFAGRG